MFYNSGQKGSNRKSSVEERIDRLEQLIKQTPSRFGESGIRIEQAKIIWSLEKKYSAAELLNISGSGSSRFIWIDNVISVPPVQVGDIVIFNVISMGYYDTATIGAYSGSKRVYKCIGNELAIGGLEPYVIECTSVTSSLLGVGRFLDSSLSQLTTTLTGGSATANSAAFWSGAKPTSGYYYDVLQPGYGGTGTSPGSNSTPWTWVRTSITNQSDCVPLLITAGPLRNGTGNAHASGESFAIDQGEPFEIRFSSVATDGASPAAISQAVGIIYVNYSRGATAYWRASITITKITAGSSSTVAIGSKFTSPASFTVGSSVSLGTIASTPFSGSFNVTVDSFGRITDFTFSSGLSTDCAVIIGGRCNA